PGVGKSAVVEGLAQQIAKGEVPPGLQRKRIVTLNMANMVAGTQYRGQFEERVRRLIEEMESHPEIILFIDEIHTIIGAGSAAGTLDAANMLKPALARGQFQCIGATTVNEYRKSIEKDGALERRFQKVMLAPTTEDETLQILRNIKERYEQHHHATYTDDALEACVRLTARYITDRALPDKAIDALDEAGSQKNLTSVVVPQDITDAEHEIAALKEQKNEAARRQQYELAANLRDEAQRRQQELDVRRREWQATLQGEHHTVDKADIAAVVSMMSGVPVSQMAQAENIRLKGMRAALAERIIAQDEAIDRLVRSITRNRIGLKDPNRPIGTFMFVGPTGVGKTYLVKTLAEFMFGSQDALIRIDMSEYGEKFSTSRLVGAPPGYVGYEEGGQLTEKVRRKPYSIILLDEIEKAHPDVFNTLLQVMDEGRMTDGNGTTVDFRNTVIVMTSNSGTRQLREFGGGIGFGTPANASGKQAEGIVRKALQRQFAPEFLNRLDDIIMFQPLDDESALKIADLELDGLRKRVEAIGHTISFTEAARKLLVKKGFDAAYGARSLKRAVQEHVEDPLTELLMDDATDATAFVADADGEKIIVSRQ
ncbi:MAG: ATP-dependent Clp protease ATP-binding subunit, partial [Bacteroidaceae bacterium]|nr:ATP-dependent Clp protease ATP-binding subunit [Bacteroidaceae bacterium]